MGGKYGNKRAIAPEREPEIISAYLKEGNCRSVAKSFGVSDETIRRILKRNNVPRKKEKIDKLKTRAGSNHKGIDRKKVGEMYTAGLSVHEIALLFGCCDMSIYYHLQKLELYEIGQSKRRKPEIIDAVECDYLAGASTYDLGKKYGVNHGTISKWMRERGHHRGKGGNPHNGGAAYAAKMREKRIQRFSEIADKVELVGDNQEGIVVRCVLCGSEFIATRDIFRTKEPCSCCREKAIEQERQQREQRKQLEAAWREAAREWRMSVPLICAECGEPFYSECDNAVYCSRVCSRKASNRRKTKRESGRAGSYRRRMRIEVNTETYDRTVNLSSVFKKYRGRCCNCGRKTYRTKNYSPQQATLDHIIALANNGTHTWDNVQLLCSECNSAKRDVGQMRLAI